MTAKLEARLYARCVGIFLQCPCAACEATRLAIAAEPSTGCAHESVLAPNGHGAFCRFCGE